MKRIPRQNKGRVALLLILLVGLTACKLLSEPTTLAAPDTPVIGVDEAIATVRSATSAPSMTALASSTASPVPSLTFTPSPTFTPLPSDTPRPEHAPALPPVEASFITNGSREQPYVALTFDLCQKPEYPAGFDRGIFDALVQANAPATFFVGGDWARTHPDEVRLLAGQPLFELGNHSWDHPDLIDLDREQISQQVLQTQEIIYQLTGEQPRLFRLPAGLYNSLVLSVIAAHGLQTIQWDVVTADPVPDNMADNINRIVREEVQNGSIIIMHANGRGWHTAEALPSMIQYLRDQGYTLVTVSQLIGLEPMND